MAHCLINQLENCFLTSTKDAALMLQTVSWQYDNGQSWSGSSTTYQVLPAMSNNVLVEDIYKHSVSVFLLGPAFFKHYKSVRQCDFTFTISRHIWIYLKQFLEKCSPPCIDLDLQHFHCHPIPPAKPHLRKVNIQRNYLYNSLKQSNLNIGGKKVSTQS